MYEIYSDPDETPDKHYGQVMDLLEEAAYTLERIWAKYEYENLHILEVELAIKQACIQLDYAKLARGREGR